MGVNIIKNKDGIYGREKEQRDDSISRKAAIDAVEKESQVDGAYGYMDTKSIVDLLMDLPSAQQWIPVSDRLPEELHDVLITKEPFKIKGYEQNVIIAERSADPRSGKIEWWSPEFGTLTDKSVLAWMPLPEPWKGDNNEYTN